MLRHRLILTSIDLLLVAFATILAITLRGNFDSVQEALMTLIPYIVITLGCASIVFFLGGLDRTPWRYSSIADYVQVIVLIILVILLALVFTFAANRLEGVARSLPIIQFIITVATLVAARAAARFWFARQIYKNGNGRDNGHYHAEETVLVAGVNTITELFLQSVSEFSSQRIQVAGILAEEPAMHGRKIRQTPIIGTVEELQNILQSLEVHGIAVDRIVVATAADRLRPRSLETLLEVEKSSNIVIHFLSERLGFKDCSGKPQVASGQQSKIVHAQKQPALVKDFDHVTFVRKSFRLKRIIDFFGAVFLISMLAPITVLIALTVALDVGFPVIFWQQRPGLYGRPFKLYKFRTMRAPHDSHSRRIPDDQRSSAFGQILRRSRLDELPQLYNVLVGDMSLIGPRPLLPRDQSPDYAARLSVRPGITGWAQVNGGRIIANSDKWLLDVWYAQNVSFVLDLRIVLRTVKIILFGDKINIEAVDQARSDLGVNALLRTEIPAE